MANANAAGSVTSGRPATIAPRLLTDLLDAAVRDHGGREAIDFMGASTSYAELGRLVDRAARGLQDLGITKGTRVGLCLPNMPQYPVLYFALHRIGAVVVNINPLYTAKEIRHLLEDSGATVVATCDVAEFYAKVCRLADELRLDKVIVCPMADVLPPVKSLLYRLFKRRDIAKVAPGGRQIGFEALTANDRAPDPVERHPDDIAVLQYTGGTTGVPKAAMLSHANLTANAAQMCAHVSGLEMRDEKIMGVLPLFHVFALTTVLNYSVDAGFTMVLLPRFEMKTFLATMKRTRCTELFAVPTIIGALNKRPAKDIAKLKSLRFCVSGGAPLPRETGMRFEELVGCSVVEGYGLSEASPIITCNPLDDVAKRDSCGVALPATTIEIRDPGAPERIVARGEKGEVCARGPQVMAGYWNRADETAAVFADGALRTGDIGYLDDDGYLFLVDRIKDVILAGGYNIYPRVIEEALYQHPAIAEAVVIGVDDPHRGQTPKAFVTLKEGQQATGQALREWLKGELNKLELPREVEIRSELPKTLIGKLSKKELVEEERTKAGGRG